jgi:hypothetical protein
VLYLKYIKKEQQVVTDYEYFSSTPQNETGPPQLKHFPIILNFWAQQQRQCVLESEGARLSLGISALI